MISTDSVVPAAQRDHHAFASAIDDVAELFIEFDFDYAARYGDAVPPAGLHGRAHALSNRARIAARDARQDQQQLIAAPSNGQVRWSHDAHEGLGYGGERVAVDAVRISGAVPIGRHVEQHHAQLPLFPARPSQLPRYLKLAALPLQ